MNGRKDGFSLAFPRFPQISKNQLNTSLIVHEFLTKFSPVLIIKNMIFILSILDQINFIK